MVDHLVRLYVDHRDLALVFDININVASLAIGGGDSGLPPRSMVAVTLPD